MKHTTTVLDLNRGCMKCGRAGVAPNGLCLFCNGIIVDPDGSPVQPPVKDTRPRLDRAQRPQGRGLAGTLYDLILRVEKLADRKFHAIPLPYGLRVEIGIGEQFNLRLSRPNASPSAVEWDTIVRYLPAAYQPAATIVPRDFKHHDGRYYLEAYWPFKQRQS